MRRKKKPVHKQSWLPFLNWFLFSGFSSFAIGGLFLLFFMVPIEQWFFNEGLSQRGIDLLMSGLIGVYALSMLGLSIAFYFFLVKPGRTKFSYSLLLIFFLLAGFVFYLFLSPTSVAIKQLQGEEEQVDRVIFGPYPDEEKLRKLKEEGYEGVITLLSPTIPFEKVLLDQELSNGETVGLQVHSFPMLPWVSDNKKALDGIQALLKNNQGKYYVHCYLGKHRVDLARTSIFEFIGKDNNRVVIFPDKIERGPLVHIKEKQLVLGPFPTDEEWFHIVLRPGIKELISTLDPANPGDVQWIEKARQIAKEYEITFTEIPVIDGADKTNLTKLHEYINMLDHSAYVFDFRSGEVMKALETKLKNIEPFVNVDVPDKFERGEIIKIGRWLAIGPYPTPEEFERLKETGFTQFISLLNEAKEADVKWIDQEKDWALANGLTYKHFSLHEDKVEAAQLYEILQYLEKQATGPVYIHGFKTGKRAQLLANLAQNYFYGAVDSKVDNNELVPSDVIENALYAKKDLLVGPAFTRDDWENGIATVGIRHIIVVDVPGFTSEEQFAEVKEIIAALPISYHTISLSETILHDIGAISTKNEGLIYIMTASELIDGMAQRYKEEVLTY
ncbi:hypothetical protein CIB95_11145 [Lottiidibacillus patelloidae]|uniref:Uncharacterized protein n=1 Tax=Lottiidibacillus patelloidae TaxID=2670334 RepID=A0A263BT69_9BACI|nr:hypothetical protein [Lottiidibacillus patelloidae]OZM56768.1 hypothetical protein CIB95_11145 [Lottiidibacillus patelloidae]